MLKGFKEIAIKANALVIDITPSTAVDQGAGAPAQRVHAQAAPEEPLQANLLALWATDQNDPVLLVTVDLLYPGRQLREAIERAAGSLQPERIVVAASHTHRAPMTVDRIPKLGSPDPQYMTGLISNISDGVRRVLDVSKAHEAEIEVGEAKGAHSVNRRRATKLYIGSRLHWNTIAIAPNTLGPVDETIIVGTIRGNEGKPLAHIWNYACHPVAHPDPASYSSHYIHHVRHRLRQLARDAQLPVLFFQGFSGNTRPNASIGARGWRGHVNRLLSGPQFRDMSRHAYEKWTKSLVERVLDGFQSTLPAHSVTLDARRVVQPGHHYARGLESDVSFQCVRLSKDFALIGVNAEVVAEYAPYVRGLVQAKFAICAGCLDNTFGYIPTKKMVDEGGYEGGGFCEHFGLQSLAPRVEEHTRRAFSRLLAD